MSPHAPWGELAREGQWARGIVSMAVRSASACARTTSRLSSSDSGGMEPTLFAVKSISPSLVDNHAVPMEAPMGEARPAGRPSTASPAVV